MCFGHALTLFLIYGLADSCHHRPLLLIRHGLMLGFAPTALWPPPDCLAPASWGIVKTEAEAKKKAWSWRDAQTEKRHACNPAPTVSTVLFLEDHNSAFCLRQRHGQRRMIEYDLQPDVMLGFPLC